MGAPKEVQTPGEFTCELCELSVHILLADATKLTLNCDSGLFYSKRFCLPCVKENLKAFPLEIQEDMDKKKPQKKSCKKTDTKHKS